MSGDAYFQFPLLVLAMRTSWDDTCNAMIGYARRHHMDVTGCSFEESGTALNMKGGTLSDANRRYDDVRRFIESLPELAAKNTTVRLKTGLVFDSRDGSGLEQRKLRVLAGIYSAIGGHPMRRVTLDDIRRRAVGCASRALFDAVCRIHKSTPTLTDKQIRNTVDDLHDSGFFARATYRCRLTFYSNRLSYDDLWKQIEKQKLPLLQRRAQSVTDKQRGEALLALASAGAASGQQTGNSRAAHGQL